MELNTQGVKTYDQLDGRLTPGLYHVVVEEVEEDSMSGRLHVTYHVINGTVPGQRDKTIKDTFFFTEKAMKRVERFAMVVDLIGPGERKNVDFAQAIGKDLIIEVGERVYGGTNPELQGKKFPSVTFMGMWTLGHEQVRSVPTDVNGAKELATLLANKIPAPKAAQEDVSAFSDL